MSLRSNLDILKLFENASRENEIIDQNDAKIEDNSSERDTDVSIRSELPATIEACMSQREAKM
jgi:hypothetical protein